jgi:4-hydroxybenzoate polyprenyltransferase
VQHSFGPMNLVGVVSIGTLETLMSVYSAHSAGSRMSRVRALVIAGHPGPCLVITAIVTALTAYAAPHGIGPVLAAPSILAGQLSVGWSNDACDAARDLAAGRTDKPIARGEISVRAVWIAAFSALAVAVILSLQIGPRWLLINTVLVGAAWAYNLGLKSTWASGLMFLLGFAPLPALATSVMPGQPWPTWQVMAAAGCLGLGTHFANVLPDLAADRATGVRGLPQIVAARWGDLAVRAVAIVLLLAASVLLLLAAIPSHRWISVIGLAASAILALNAFRSSGKTPFYCALGIAAVDVVLFLTGSVALT